MPPRRPPALLARRGPHHRHHALASHPVRWPSLISNLRPCHAPRGSTDPPAHPRTPASPRPRLPELYELWSDVSTSPYKILSSLPSRPLLPPPPPPLASHSLFHTLLPPLLLHLNIRLHLPPPSHSPSSFPSHSLLHILLLPFLSTISPLPTSHSLIPPHLLILLFLSLSSLPIL